MCVVGFLQDTPFRPTGGVDVKAVVVGVSRSAGERLSKYRGEGFVIYPMARESEEYMLARLPSLLPWSFSSTAFLGEYAKGEEWTTT